MVGTRHRTPISLQIQSGRGLKLSPIAPKPISANTLFERIETVIERPRPFVCLTDFFGPDRRRKAADYTGDERRQETKELSQDEVNVLIISLGSTLANRVSLKTRTCNGGISSQQLTSLGLHPTRSRKRLYSTHRS